ncbi:MAG TPA: alpha-L-arabinofuranosidase C-terminal domain-containing protein, partial [Chitinophagaceae bacterium]|nr:alpha-L-arabinofuranosidase C-terminal domain-containing protein [Chitinophagaceae bacterium]
KRYDNYDRNGSKIFAGEYAAHSNLTDDADKKNNWQSALAEAAFMTGLERNADAVSMASYAPLFAHIDGWQWAPDLIWFNNLQSYASPNYYVQQMYSLNKGSQVVPIVLNNEIIAGQDSLYAAACTDQVTHDLIIKLVNVSGKEQIKNISVNGVKKLSATASVTVLACNELNKANSFLYPVAIAPKDESLAIKNKNIAIKLMPYSFQVIRIKISDN